VVGSGDLRKLLLATPYLQDDYLPPPEGVGIEKDRTERQDKSDKDKSLQYRAARTS